MYNEQFKDSVQSFLMDASHKYFQKSFEVMSGFGIHPGQIPILRLLSAAEGMSQREIASRLRIKPPTVNVSIARLEKSGHVCRRPDGRDQRVSRVFLTDLGREADRELRALVLRNEEVLVSGFSESEVCLFKRMMRHLIENMDLLPGGDVKTETSEGRKDAHAEAGSEDAGVKTETSEMQDDGDVTTESSGSRDSADVCRRDADGRGCLAEHEE